MKQCIKCNEFKDFSDFNKKNSNKDYLRSMCKICEKKYHKEYYLKNKQRIKKCSRKYQRDNKARRKEYNNSNALYKTYKDKLTREEDSRLSEDGISLEVKCRYCGKYFIPTNLQIRNRINSLNTGQRECGLYCSNECKQLCPMFTQATSKPEQEIQKYVKSLINNVICNDRRTILNPNTGWYLELDVYLPDLKKAIEFNGTYWHSFSVTEINDRIKQNECKKLGIDLLIIDEEDYNVDKQIELDKIQEFIGI